MSNQEVTALLKDAQAFWFRWRDNVPDFSDIDKWDVVLKEANQIADDHGGSVHVTDLMVWFCTELHERSKERS